MRKMREMWSTQTILIGFWKRTKILPTIGIRKSCVIFWIRLCVCWIYTVVEEEAIIVQKITSAPVLY